MVFLTSLAPEARLGGSRDPLGLLPVWARLGRQVDDIAAAEHTLAPCERLFSFMLSRDKQRVEDVASEVAMVWTEPSTHTRPQSGRVKGTSPPSSCRPTTTAS